MVHTGLAPSAVPSSKPVGVVAAVALVAVVVATLWGPFIAIGVAAAGIVVVLAVRIPVLALLLPVVCAPVALRPIPGIGGAQVIHLAVLAALGAVAVNLVTGRLRTSPPMTMVGGAAFLAAILLSAITSEHTLVALRGASNHLLGFLLALAVSAVVRQPGSSLTWLLRGWALAALAVIAPALPAAATASSRFGGTLVENRVQGVFAQPNDFGEFSLLAMIMGTALLFRPESRGDRWLGGVGLLLGLTGVAVSFSRGTWIGLIAFVVMLCLLYPPFVKWGALGLIVTVTSSVVGSAAGAPPFPTILGRAVALAEAGRNPQDDRPLIYSQALGIFEGHPVTGVGLSSYINAAAQPGTDFVGRAYIHGHSVLLTVAAELGVVGVVSLVGFTIALGVGALRGLRALRRIGERAMRGQLAALSAGLFAIGIHGLIDVVYTNPFLIPLAWMLAGMVAGLSARAASMCDQRRPPDAPEALEPATSG